MGFHSLPRLPELGPTQRTPLLRHLLWRLQHHRDNSCFVSEPPLSGLRWILRSRQALPILDPEQSSCRDRHVRLEAFHVCRFAHLEVHIDVRDAQGEAHADLVVVDVSVVGRSTPNRNVAAGAEVIEGHFDVAEPDVDHAQLEVGDGEERVDGHGVEEPRLALALLAEVQVDLADVEVDVRDGDVRGEPAHLVVHCEGEVEVVLVEVDLGEALDVDLSAVGLGRRFSGLRDDRLD